jgi:vancomycin permeability regulator SanA
MKWFKRLLKIGVIGGFGLVMMIFIVNRHVSNSTKTQIYNSFINYHIIG